MKQRTVSKEDAEIIGQIVDRLERELPEYFNSDNRTATVVLFFDVHRAVPLQLGEMLTGRLSDIGHDVGLMRNKWDGEKFLDCSWPRFAARG